MAHWSSLILSFLSSRIFGNVLSPFTHHCRIWRRMALIISQGRLELCSLSLYLSYDLRTSAPLADSIEVRGLCCQSWTTTLKKYSCLIHPSQSHAFGRLSRVKMLLLKVRTSHRPTNFLDFVRSICRRKA